MSELYNAVHFMHPFTCIVSAPTKAGKTEFVKKLILHKDNLIEPTPAAVIWSYAEWQPAYEQLQRYGVKFVEGLTDLDSLKADQHIPKLLVLDDQMMEMKNDKCLIEIFTRGCHHWNMSIMHIVQNAFFSGLRTSCINP